MLSELRAASAAAASTSRERVSALESQAEAAQVALAARPTLAQVAALRQKLRLLQAVGYNAIEEGEEGFEEGAPARGGSLRGHGREGEGELTPASASEPSLEAQLLRKNQRVEHELTRARLAIAEREERSAVLVARLGAAEAEVVRQQASPGRPGFGGFCLVVQGLSPLIACPPALSGGAAPDAHIRSSAVPSFLTTPAPLGG